MRELHLQERPIAMLAAQNANLNRDVKKRKTPFALDDFYLYQPADMINAPAERYGAAAYWLVENQMYPSFALFCFPELNKRRGKNVPTVVAYLHKHAVLLAPVKRDGFVKGLLIAENHVEHKVIDMRSPCGQEITVKIPGIGQEVAAQEDISLELC